ncbi:biofilm development regulator YmgB/AriR family protein [Serratia sp. M24T3]|uniref:biofilm development regulator YmgB/AriR family protein n=1 Tax=Serratia sp. M24T3 TaxID=932213 RepID=UPI00025BB216|nr:biofilm development regulator YmgB/AriR family protein [Serratia sp. M24T3]EIC83449.1 Biofilm development protein YmgB/AriR [Serratia sp. M24T3]
MYDMFSTDLKLADYIHVSNPENYSGNQVVSSICRELKQHRQSVSNKDIILRLITLIEAEQDANQHDAYLKALEYVVYSTPDDLD